MLNQKSTIIEKHHHTWNVPIKARQSEGKKLHRKSLAATSKSFLHLIESSTWGLQKILLRNFSGTPVVRTQCFRCRGHGFQDPRGCCLAKKNNKSLMPAIKTCNVQCYRLDQWLPDLKDKTEKQAGELVLTSLQLGPSCSLWVFHTNEISNKKSPLPARALGLAPRPQGEGWTSCPGWNGPPTNSGWCSILKIWLTLQSPRSCPWWS